MTRVERETMRMPAQPGMRGWMAWKSWAPTTALMAEVETQTAIFMRAAVAPRDKLLDYGVVAMADGARKNGRKGTYRA